MQAFKNTTLVALCVCCLTFVIPNTRDAEAGDTNFGCSDPVSKNSKTKTKERLCFRLRQGLTKQPWLVWLVDQDGLELMETTCCYLPKCWD